MQKKQYDPNMTKIDQEIKSKEFVASKGSKRAIAYCDDCGKKIYQTDATGLPYRLCFVCSRK